MNPQLAKFWQWTRRFVSPWTLACIVAFGIVVFYGDNSVFDSIRQEQIVDSLRCELASIRDSTEHYRRLNERLVSEPAMVEQVARENYGMKKANEDVYNFVESND